MIRSMHSSAALVSLRFLSLILGLGAINIGAAASGQLVEVAVDVPVVSLDGQSGGALQNDRIEARWHIENGRLTSMTIRDKTAHSESLDATLKLDGPFSIELKSIGVLRASDLLMSAPASMEKLLPNPTASRASDRLPGVTVHYPLADPAGRFQADWSLTLRQGSSYIRQLLTITAGSKPLPLSGLAMIDVSTRQASPLPEPSKALRSPPATSSSASSRRFPRAAWSAIAASANCKVACPLQPINPRSFLQL